MIPESKIREVMELLRQRADLWQAERHLEGCRRGGSTPSCKLVVGPVELEMDGEVVAEYLRTCREQLDRRFERAGIQQEFRPGTNGP